MTQEDPALSVPDFWALDLGKMNVRPPSNSVRISWYLSKTGMKRSSILFWHLLRFLDAGNRIILSLRSMQSHLKNAESDLRGPIV